MTSDNTIPFSSMKEQVRKKNVTHRPSQLVNPPSIQSEDELFDRETNLNLSYSKIKKQVRKKDVSKKSKKERITAKSVSLSERLGHRR